jgi:hypothetical protein
VKVVDFGIARLLNAPREGEDRSISGTPEYMAPELIGGAPPSVATDLYAVGIVAYEMLTGQTPFVGGSAIDILSRQLKLEPRPPGKVVAIASAIDELVMTALAKRPGDRYADAAAMRAAIAAQLAPGALVGRLRLRACGAQAAAEFRFCPECGQPRKALSTTAEMAAANGGAGRGAAEQDLAAGAGRPRRRARPRDRLPDRGRRSRRRCW